MIYYAIAISTYDKNRLEHFGIKGQRWGIRRYQNEDGTLTEEGKKRYTYSDGRQSKMSLAGRLKFGKKYADEYNESERIKSMGGKTNKEYDQEASKEFKELSEQEDKMLALNKRMDSFDKVKSAAEKFAILDDVIKASHELYKNGDKEGSSEIMDFWWDNKDKAGEAAISEYEALSAGKERDQKLTQLLIDSAEHGQDSEYLNGLINRMQAKHGDYLSRNFKTEAARKAAEEADAAMEEETRIGDLYYKQDQKLGKYKKDPYGSSYFMLDKLAADHPEVKQAMDNRESKWEKYCEQVLKDMGMPVNEDTLDAIMSVIIWN